MSECFRSHIAVLKRLRKSTPFVRKKIISEADKDLIKTLCEVAHNTLQNKVPLNKKQYKDLVRHKKILRKLAKQGENWKKKKKVIKQSGGFILPLLAPILGIFLQKLLL
jgi:hypothetical protein